MIDSPAGFVFSTTGRRPITGFSKAKTALDRAMLAQARAEAGDSVTVLPWRLHDLRRTAATGMAELGVLPHVVEAALNHVSGARAGVAGVYNKATYAPGEAGGALALGGACAGRGARQAGERRAPSAQAAEAMTKRRPSRPSSPSGSAGPMLRA